MASRPRFPRRRTARPEPAPVSIPDSIEPAALDIPDHDPLMAFLLSAGSPVDTERIDLDSPALHRLRAAGVTLVVPLISQGELIGTLNLGRRLSDQPYSTDDRRLLAGLASQVAPAIRVAQLVRQQEAEAKERERYEQELRVASLIQQTLLPKDLPTLPGWEVDAYYRPARAVGGDFYDFVRLDDDRLGIFIGDVTDKGVPAALVMATTRSNLRAAAQRYDDPGRVLADVNDVLVAEIPPAMFVTCLYAILELTSGKLVYANAGHNLPYVRTLEGVVELRATGMPLGLMPGMAYEVKEAALATGDAMLLTSDGIAEAHAPDGGMFGLGRLMGLVGSHTGHRSLISSILAELDRFRGSGGDPEDDVTMVLVRRTTSAAASAAAFEPEWTRLDAFELASEEGNERLALSRVAELVHPLGMEPPRLERLKTAVAEATMNAIEHGNGSNPSLPVRLEVLAAHDRVRVRISDLGGDRPVPNPEAPDLEAKLDGLQSPRGWGLFLIREMVDDMRTQTSESGHLVELEMLLQGGEEA